VKPLKVFDLPSLSMRAHQLTQTANTSSNKLFRCNRFAGAVLR